MVQQLIKNKVWMITHFKSLSSSDAMLGFMYQLVHQKVEAVGQSTHTSIDRIINCATDISCLSK